MVEPGLPTADRWRASTPQARTAVRYVAGSVATALAGQVLLFGLFVGLRWSARSAQASAFVLTGVLSYGVNRRWVWGRRGRSDFWREIVPFWVIAAAGLFLSTVGAGVAESRVAHLTGSRLLQGLAVDGTSVAIVAALWAAKFVLLDRLFERSPT